MKSPKLVTKLMIVKQIYRLKWGFSTSKLSKLKETENKTVADMIYKIKRISSLVWTIDWKSPFKFLNRFNNLLSLKFKHIFAKWMAVIN